MSPQLDKKLVREHPTLFASRYAPMSDTAMCWGFACGDGWYEIIKEAADKLEPILRSCKERDPEGWKLGYYRASQVKEKYGTLRFYLTAAPDEAYMIVDELERKSAQICE